MHATVTATNTRRDFNASNPEQEHLQIVDVMQKELDQEDRDVRSPEAVAKMIELERLREVRFGGKGGAK